MQPKCLWFFPSMVLIFTCALAIVKLPENVTVPALFMFGDSIVDTGNNNYLTWTIVKSNFPPYGKDFRGGVPTGRFCNGKVPADFVVEELGIKEYLPAYLDPTLQEAELLTGVNFASSASGYDPFTSFLLQVMSLSDQVDMLKDYIERLTKYVGEEKANYIISNSIFMVESGSDDIVNTYYHTLTRILQYDINGYTDLMLNGALTFVQRLYELGARRIGIVSLPPIGCLPLERTLDGGRERKCSDKTNDAAMMLNSKLAAMADYQTNYNLTDAKVVYMDAFYPFLDIIQNYQKYGFEVANLGCCGTGLLEVAIFCNQFTSWTCKNTSAYVFWDSYHPSERAYSYHPSERAYQILCRQVVQNSIHKFF